MTTDSRRASEAKKRAKKPRKPLGSPDGTGTVQRRGRVRPVMRGRLDSYSSWAKRKATTNV